MAEEQQRIHCQPPSKLCANNCGFVGDPATQNLCSNCFARSLPHQFRLSPPSLVPSSSSPSVASGEDHAPRATPSPAKAANRCAACRRRVGLTGFGCRCGSTFCGTHRHPESHSCGFDYKAVGKDQIAMANPRVMADKLARRI